MKLQNRQCKVYVDGVNSFLEVAKNTLNAQGKTRCPCTYCMNSFYGDITSIEQHLYMRGISPTYNLWIFHGEEPEAFVSPCFKQTSLVNKETVVPPHSEPGPSSVNKKTVV